MELTPTILAEKAEFMPKLENQRLQRKRDANFFELHVLSNLDYFSSSLINLQTAVCVFILDQTAIIKCEHYSSPMMSPPFCFAVIFVPLVCARTLQGWVDHSGVTLVWLWFLDRALGPRLGGRFKHSLASLLSNLHFRGATKCFQWEVERHSLWFP